MRLSRRHGRTARSRLPAPPHERRRVLERLCAEQRPQHHITGYLGVPARALPVTHKINTCLLCYEEIGDTARKTLPSVDLSYLHIYLPQHNCFVFIQGYIQTKSLTAIAFLNCIFFRAETCYLLHLNNIELSTLASGCDLHHAKSKYCV